MLGGKQTERLEPKFQTNKSKKQGQRHIGADSRVRVGLEFSRAGPQRPDGAAGSLIPRCVYNKIKLPHASSAGTSHSVHGLFLAYLADIFIRRGAWWHAFMSLHPPGGLWVNSGQECEEIVGGHGGTWTRELGQ